MQDELVEVEEEKPLPAVFEHCMTVYRLMEEEAHLVTSDDPNPTLVWTGHLTKLFQRLHLSVPYYTSVTRELKRMGCIRQMRRGGGNAPSLWQIIHEPTEELFRQDNPVTHNLASRRPTKVGMLEQQVRDLQKAVSKIQADYEAILDILIEKEKTDA